MPGMAHLGEAGMQRTGTRAREADEADEKRTKRTKRAGQAKATRHRPAGSGPPPLNAARLDRLGVRPGPAV